MDLYEYEGKQLLAKYGVALPRSGLAHSPEAAAAVQADLGVPVVVKGQALSGGRGKAGLIRFAEKNNVSEVASDILSASHHGEQIRSVLIEERLNSATEFYASVCVDVAARTRKLLLSASGGVDIEASRDAVRQLPFRKDNVPNVEALESVWNELGVDQRSSGKLAVLTRSMIALFLETRALQVEINPVGIVDNRAFALDAKITLDDSAIPPNVREKTGGSEETSGLGFSLIRLDGDIGVITSGAGLGLATIDTIKASGACAANFLDLGGGATVERMRAAVELVASLSGIQGLLINVHGGLNDCELLAQGAISGLARQKGLAALVRMSGFRAAEGRTLLKAAGIENAGAEPIEWCVARLLDTMKSRMNWTTR